MVKRSFFQLIGVAGLLVVLLLGSCKKSNVPTIGIIEPLEHKAMVEIVEGFTTTFKMLYPYPVRIKVSNAQNDPNLKRAIIEKMRDAKYAVILPIGVDATQMTLTMVHEQPIVSLASDLSDETRHKLHPCNVAVVQDEIAPANAIAFIHAVYPQLRYITLIHSPAPKVIPEVKASIAAGKRLGITITARMVASLPDLYTTSFALPQPTQAIFVLKDSLIVSGTATLAKLAAQKHIPLISSDQGSVQDGAAFALGVPEREIGVEGAKLTAAILQGKSACELPIARMKNFEIFINKTALSKESQSVTPIVKAAHQFHYPVKAINTSND